jgi:hypothetical protein
MPGAFPAFAGAASRLRAEALRRASAQAGRPFVMLTYSTVRSACQSGCALLANLFEHSMKFPESMTVFSRSQYVSRCEKCSTAPQENHAMVEKCGVHGNGSQCLSGTAHPVVIDINTGTVDGTWIGWVLRIGEDVQGCQRWRYLRRLEKMGRVEPASMTCRYTSPFSRNSMVMNPV